MPKANRTATSQGLPAWGGANMQKDRGYSWGGQANPETAGGRITLGNQTGVEVDC